MFKKLQYIYALSTVMTYLPLHATDRELPENSDYYYASPQELVKKATDTKITYNHGLPSFTVCNMGEGMRSFFKENGKFPSEPIDCLPNVKIVNGIAIDLESNLAEGPTVHLGQDLTTKEFLAFKRFNSINVSITDKSEIQTLQQAGIYRGIVEDKSLYAEGKPRSFVAITLFAGLPFTKIWRLSSLINQHTRYLIAYNLIKEMERFSSLGLFQKDQQAGNFMVDFRDFSVKFIDFGRVEKVSDANKRSYELKYLFQFIFASSPEDNMSKSFEKSIAGSFKELFEAVNKNANLNTEESVRLLPFLHT